MVPVDELFGNKIRVRVCGLLRDNDRLLMVKHKGLGPNGIFWIPPGGGAEFGDSLSANLKREFWEETGIKVVVGDILFLHEYFRKPLHAVEIFFQVTYLSGHLKRGFDPETGNKLIIEEVSFLSFDQIIELGRENVHQIFSHCNSLSKLFNLRGYYTSIISK